MPKILRGRRVAPESLFQRKEEARMDFVEEIRRRYIDGMPEFDLTIEEVSRLAERDNLFPESYFDPVDMRRRRIKELCRQKLKADRVYDVDGQKVEARVFGCFEVRGYKVDGGRKDMMVWKTWEYLAANNPRRRHGMEACGVLRTNVRKVTKSMQNAILVFNYFLRQNGLCPVTVRELEQQGL